MSSTSSSSSASSIISRTEYETAVNRVLTSVVNSAHHHQRHHLRQYLQPSVPLSEQRGLIRQLLTIQSPTSSLSTSLLSDMDAVLAYELAHSDVTDATTLPKLAQLFPPNDNTSTTSSSSSSSLSSFLSSVSVWRGSITQLRADAIVNAANSALLGCFQPTHLCIDNVIHAAAGPRLRQACADIMRKNNNAAALKKNKTNKHDNDEGEDDDGDEWDSEPAGRCRITPAFSLPSRFVLHTVGPQLERPRHHHHHHDDGECDHEDDDAAPQPTASDVSTLASCYTSCLDAAIRFEASPPISSIAFCCISTGLFAFPQQEAAQIAIETVRKWLVQHKANGGRPLHIIFNVFKEDDERYYMQFLQKLCGGVSPTIRVPSGIDQANVAALQLACEWAKQSTSMLISGAAGLSAAAGLDYTSQSLFKTLFPVMWNRGHRCMYEFIGYKDWSPALQWGYLLTHTRLARYNWPKHTVYQALLQIAQKLPTWVNTTNADGMFEQNGFPTSNIYTIQGDYGYMQCLKPCSPLSRWPTTSFHEALKHIDPSTMEITDPKQIPKCRNCGGPVRLNVRGGDWFIEEPFFAMRDKFQQWMQQHVHQPATAGASTSSSSSNRPPRLLIVEIGAGFNTPSVLRWPNERLAAQHDNVFLVRINMQHSQVPMHLQKTKAVGIQMDATQAVTAIANALGIHVTPTPNTPFTFDLHTKNSHAS